VGESEEKGGYWPLLLASGAKISLQMKVHELKNNAEGELLLNEKLSPDVAQWMGGHQLLQTQR
jgi:hypothetical protein